LQVGHAEFKILPGSGPDFDELGERRPRSGTTERLAVRAQQMLLLAEITDDNPDQQTRALDIFNAAQMGGAARHPRLK
jgi:hypothetical protein